MDRLRELVAGELRATLARRRISAAALARQLGWSQTYTARRVDGRAAIDMDDLEAIARVLEIEVTDLIPATVRPNRRSAAVPIQRTHTAARRVVTRPNGRPLNGSTRPPSRDRLTQRRPMPVTMGSRSATQ